MSIQESSNFDSEIYELKTTDKAVGGADGISNLQAKQLANRTQWLKQKLEELQGQSLQSLAIDEHGHLIVTLADESVEDLGLVIGPTGEGMPVGGLVGQLPVKKSLADFDFEWQDKPANGAPGLSIASATINETGHLIITLSDASTIDAGEVAGVPDAPSDGKQYARKDAAWDEVAVFEKLKIKQLEVSTYTLVAADANTAIHCNQNLASMVITVPSGVFSAGDQVTIIREDDVASVTLNFSDYELKVNGDLTEVSLPGAFSAVTLICKGGNYFTLIGDYE